MNVSHVAGLLCTYPTSRASLDHIFWWYDLELDYPCALCSCGLSRQDWKFRCFLSTALLGNLHRWWGRNCRRDISKSLSFLISFPCRYEAATFKPTYLYLEKKSSVGGKNKNTYAGIRIALNDDEGEMIAEPRFARNTETKYPNKPVGSFIRRQFHRPHHGHAGSVGESWRARAERSSGGCPPNQTGSHLGE